MTTFSTFAILRARGFSNPDKQATAVVPHSFAGSEWPWLLAEARVPHARTYLSGRLIECFGAFPSNVHAVTTERFNISVEFVTGHRPDGIPPLRRFGAYGWAAGFITAVLAVLLAAFPAAPASWAHSPRWKLRR